MQDHIDQMLQELAHYAAGGDVHPHVEQMARELAEHNKAKFLEGSQVQDRVFHGTGMDFNIPNTRGESGKTADTGMFFSSNPAVASTYVSGEKPNVMPAHLALKNPMVIDAKGHHWNNIPQHAKVTVPGITTIDPDEHLMAELEGREPNLKASIKRKARSTSIGRLFKGDFDYPDDTTSTDDMARWARKQGYDGLVMHNVIDRGPSGKYATDEAKLPSSMYVAFHPHQIKSATGNSGAYDARNPDITMAHGGSVAPSYDDMLAHVMLHKAEGGSIRHEPTNIGVDEAPGMVVKRYMPAGVSDGRGNIPVGGVDMNQGQPGQQFAPEQPPQGMPPQGAPGQPPAGMPPTGPQAPAGPPSNILNMTRQGQAMSAMKAPAPAQMARPVAPPNPSPLIKNGMARMAEGGIVNEKHEKNRMEFLRGSQVPERVYHGTGNLENMESFDPEQTGKGNDQLGSGFYFTNKPETANSYTGSVSPSAPKGATKLGGDTSPGVIAAHLAIKKPLRVGPEGSHLGDAGVNMTHMQVKRIMNMAPNIKHRDKSPLADHVDTSRGVSPAMIHDVAKHYTGSSLHMLENDMFKNDPTAYREALHKVLGYDGVIKDFGNGEKHYVAWFPHQIKSAIGNRGTYDTNSDKITRKEGGSVKPVVRGIIKEQVTVIPDLAAMKRALMKAKR